MSYCALDGIEDVIEVLAEVFGEEAEDEIPMLLERGILATVATIGGGISQMLTAIQFDDETEFLPEEINFHSALCIKGDGELGVQAEEAGGARQGLQAAVEKCFARAARSVHTFGLGGHGVKGVHKEACQRNVHPSSDW